MYPPSVWWKLSTIRSNYDWKASVNYLVNNFHRIKYSSIDWCTMLVLPLILYLFATFFWDFVIFSRDHTIKSMALTFSNARTFTLTWIHFDEIYDEMFAIFYLHRYRSVLLCAGIMLKKTEKEKEWTISVSFHNDICATCRSTGNVQSRNVHICECFGLFAMLMIRTYFNARRENAL